MSSSNRTETIGLNSWLGSDRPERADFNSDNEIIDSVFAEHFEDDCHISDEERAKWNSPYFTDTYFGDASQTRTIQTACPFTPSWGIVFRVGAMPATTDFSNSRNLNHFAIASQNGSMAGISLSGTSLTVRQSGSALSANEYAAMNSLGEAYCYILFR